MQLRKALPAMLAAEMAGPSQTKGALPRSSILQGDKDVAGYRSLSLTPLGIEFVCKTMSHPCSKHLAE